MSFLPGGGNPVRIVPLQTLGDVLRVADIVSSGGVALKDVKIKWH